MKLGNMFKKTNQKNYITLTNRKANVQNSGESSPEVPEGLMPVSYTHLIEEGFIHQTSGTKELGEGCDLNYAID